LVYNLIRWKLAVFVQLFILSSAHLCLENPPMDGGFPKTVLMNPGSATNCGSTVAPCGGDFYNGTTTPLIGGALNQVTVVLDQSMFNATNPGTIALSYCFLNGSNNCQSTTNFTPFDACFAADSNVVTNSASVTFNVTFPYLNGTVILRATYTTNYNGIIYYSCSTLSLNPSLGSPLAMVQCIGTYNFVPIPPTIPPMTTLPPLPYSQSSSPMIQVGSLLLGYPVLYVGIAIGILALIVILIFIIIVVVAVKVSNRRRYNDMDGQQRTTIPTMSLQEIQSTKMQVIEEPPPY